MGCYVFYEGKLNDEILQEKIVRFFLTMDKDADLVVNPHPDSKYKTTIKSRQNREAPGQIIEAYPFNFYGIVPSCKKGIVEHFQFVFNRTEAGEIGYFRALPGIYGYPPAREEDKHIQTDGIQVCFQNGGNTRIAEPCFTEYLSFPLFLNIIKLRWWPDFKLSDGYLLCDQAWEMIWRYGLAKAFKDENIGFPECKSLFVEAYYKQKQA